MTPRASLAWVVFVTALLVAPASPARAASSATAPFVEATLNVRYTNSSAQIAADVSKGLRRASVLRLQEVWGHPAVSGLRRALARHPSWRASWRTLYTGNVIAWDARRWDGVGRARALRVNDGVAGVTPDRYLVSKVLRDRASARLVTFADVHAVSGYCTGWPHLALRRAYARDYWRTAAAWTRRQVAQYPTRAVLLGGDFNCWLWRRTLPARALAPVYQIDRRGGYDHLLTARMNDAPSVSRLWKVAAFSDHPLVLRRLIFGH